MNIAAKIVELSLKKLFASQKPTNSPPARTVTAPTLEKSCLPLFHLERDRLPPPALRGVAAGPAAAFPEEDKVNGRAPFSHNYTQQVQRSIMGTATVKWISGKQFIGIDSTHHSVVLSTPDEGVGIKPSELLLIAVASCSAVDVVEILSKKRMPLNHLEISCSGEQDQDPPWTFRKIHLRFIVGGKNLTEKAVAQAIQLSEEKYCSVAATVRATAQITTEFEILEEEPQLVAQF
ncbi:MAG TPA: OsmC family protein [Anaerolineales bacterium]|nr:OsmC family protein [Anaerolineales bacterium]